MWHASIITTYKDMLRESDVVGRALNGGGRTDVEREAQGTRLLPGSTIDNHISTFKFGSFITGIMMIHIKLLR